MEKVRSTICAYVIVALCGVARLDAQIPVLLGANGSPIIVSPRRAPSGDVAPNRSHSLH